MRIVSVNASLAREGHVHGHDPHGPLGLLEAFRNAARAKYLTPPNDGSGRFPEGFTRD